MTSAAAAPAPAPAPAAPADRFRVAPGPYDYVPRLPVPPHAHIHELDQAVADLRANADAWTRATPERRLQLLDEVAHATLAVAARWTELGSIHEGLAPGTKAEAEEAIIGPYLFLRGVRLLRRAIADIARSGKPKIPGGIRTLPNGQVAARVMPTDAADWLMYLGTTADVWMDPSVTAETLPDTMAVNYRTPPPGRVCLVLGAGNASSIGPLDVVHKVFVELQTVVLKIHPVMAHLTEVQSAALAPLIRAGLVRVVSGDAIEGAHLAHHAGVDTLHVTGADRTYDAIVFGNGPEGAERKRLDQPVLDKPFTAELGNLTPIIVVPGRWSAMDLDYHAENLVTMLANNAGFNCTASRVIVLARDWPQRAALMDRVRARLAALPTRLAYYPGSQERFAAFQEAYPQAETFGRPAAGELPWMLIGGLSPDAVGDPAYRVEAFCSVTAETLIDAADAATFLDKATAFVNERLWGTLSATVIVDPATARSADTRPALDRAIAQLRYGTVSLNHWSSIGYGLGITPWGAYPGHPRNDIGSGSGFVHNPLMFERSQKSVVRSWFRAWPHPMWFTDHTTAHLLMPHLIRFEVDRRPDRLLPIFWHALRG